MSEFDEMMTESLAETQDVLGTVPFWWSGFELRGDFSRLDESYEIDEGGRKLVVTASLFAARTQFALAYPRKGQRLKVGNDTYEVAHVESDALGFTIFLAADMVRGS